MKGGAGRWGRGMAEGEEQEGVSRGVRGSFWLPMGAGRAQCSFLEGAELRGAV